MGSRRRSGQGEGSVSSDARPDVKEVLAGLKDFQQATVDYVFDRLYGIDATRRFLLADEVGLGKTLVAKGVIARAVDRLWDDVERIDIIYICSNADIARQNLTRLRSGSTAFTLPSRITLLPLNIDNLRHRKLNFVSFTPGTSLEPRSAMGTAEERALLLRMLRDPWELGRRRGPRKVFQGTTRTIESFEWSLETIETRPLNEDLADAFHQAIAGRADLRARYEEVLSRYAYARDTFSLPQEVKDERRDLIGELRHTLAQTCIKALEPDLVLLDEFQRFRHLLAGEDEAADLARELFDWQDEDTNVRARVLLMSATPYKMFTVNGEPVDDHYQDFVATLTFLAGSERAAQIGELLGQFRRELLAVDSAANPRLLAIHAEIQRELRRVMVRTERLGSSEDRNGMLRTCSSQSGAMTEQDVADYLTAQGLARAVGEPDVVEYWKSSPYLLNLLGDGYKLIREVKATTTYAAGRRDVTAALLAARLLDPADIRRWKEIDPGSARMRGLIEETVKSGAWKLLWIPPSLPHYEPAGPFAEPQLRRQTKRLVFSSWNVVPRAIAALVSYTAERELWKAAEPDALNTQEVRQARRGRLAFAASSDGRLTGMPTLALLYPSATLATRCDPLAFATARAGDELATLEELRAWAVSQVADLLAAATARAPQDGPEDEAWYWAAPLIIDALSHDDAACAWLTRADAIGAWSGRNREEEGSRWADHVKRAQDAARGANAFGRPPADLAEVVAELGLFGLGNTSLRALSRVTLPDTDAGELRVAAAQIAWSLRTLFNLPEVCAFVPTLVKDRPYWQQCLDYAASGGLQSVLDEYVHLLVESLGHTGGTNQAVSDIATRMSEALTLAAGRINAEEVQVDHAANTVDFEPLRMRARFAARFGDQETDEGSGATRADSLRAAFNSPFWPFVLATTSVGQEGLDFHHYCHAVIHWNIPTNPVDLEQREGRVHRYKNHAVRKNLAQRYSSSELHNGTRDPWAALFDAGRRDRAKDETDLVPYWLYPLKDGAAIERHVPILPLSREVERFAALCRSLAIYRMAFGQPRQEDLVAYLLNRLPHQAVTRLMEEVRIDLTPPPRPPDFSKLDPDHARVIQ